MSLTAYISTDNVMSVTISDSINGTDLSGATVEVTLEQTDGTDVVGETWPLSLSHVSGTTSALFRATLADTLEMEESVNYRAVVVADNGPGQRRTWRVPVVAEWGDGSA